MKLLSTAIVLLSASGACAAPVRCKSISYCSLPESCEQVEQQVEFEIREKAGNIIQIDINGKSFFELPFISSFSQREVTSYFFSFESSSIMATINGTKSLTLFGLDTHGKPAIMNFECEALG